MTTSETTPETSDLTIAGSDGLPLAATLHHRRTSAGDGAITATSATSTEPDPSSLPGTETPRGGERPVVVAIHGYPDHQGVWSAVVPHLLPHADVLTYDVRGAGRTPAPTQPGGYDIDLLRRDVDLVVEHARTLSPRVSLLAHDWGSIQAWQAVTDDGAAGEVDSFTSISGPCLDHVGRWMRAAQRDARGGDRQAARRFAQQSASSSYIPFFRLPRLPEMAIRSGVMTRLLAGAGAPHDAGTVSRAQRYVRAERDYLNGLELYRTNMVRRRRDPSVPKRGPRTTSVPTQVIVCREDRYVREPIATSGEPYVEHFTISHVDAGHWAVRSAAAEVAGLVVQHLSAQGRDGSIPS